MYTIVTNDLNFSVIDGDSTRKILNNISIKIPQKGVTVIYGPSGSGKTTLLYALGGLLENIDSGEVRIHDFSLYKMKLGERDALRLNHMGLVFQNFNLFPYMSVIDNIFVTIYARNMKPTAEDKERLYQLVDLLELRDCIKKPVTQLSGGEQQKVAIIRAFIGNPAIIICDEPTANLDRKNSVVFYEKIQSLAHLENRSVVIVSHDELARKYCDYAIQIIDGEIR